MPSNSVYRIFQDSRGYIWIANEEGLTRYDGFEFKTYTNPKQTSRPGSEITEDKYGRIWYQNFDGYLYYVENDSLKALQQNDPIGYFPYGIINNHLLLLQKNGIDIIDLKSLRCKRTILLDLTSLGSVACGQTYYNLLVKQKMIQVDESGNVKRTTIDFNGSLAAHENDLFLIEKEQKNGWCYKFNNGAFRKHIETKRINFIQNFSEAGGKYWLCTSTGVWAFDSTGESINNNQPLYAAKNISCVFKDGEDNYWIGTLDEGILFIPDFDTKLISADARPDKLTRYKDDLLIATGDNCVYKYDIGESALKMLYKDEVKHRVNALLVDTINNRILVAGQRLKIFDEQFRILYNNSVAVKDIVVIDDKYYALAATGVSGLLTYNIEKKSPWDNIYKSTLDKTPNIALNIAGLIPQYRGRYIVYNKSSETIFAATNSGVFSITKVGANEVKYRGNHIRTRSMVAYNNCIYLLTADNDVLQIDEQLNITSLVDKQKDILFYKMKQVEDKLLFFTSIGIFRLYTEPAKLVPLDILSGIMPEEINDIEQVGGKYYIASSIGLLATDSTVSRPVTPILHFNFVTANGKLFAVDKEKNSFNYNYRNNNVEINYSIINFKKGGFYPLYYRINEGKWINIGRETRTLRLASLAPGDYKIDFRLGSYEVSDRLPVQTINIHIDNPYWLKTWFFVLCGLVVLICLVLLNRWQTGILKKKNILLEEKMELEKDLQKSILVSIRSQMNPHFFYNALNTIQAFIFSNDKRNAATYLVKLSKLTRLILEMTERENISMEEEINALQLYLDLEKIRFEEDFNFQIKTADNLDTALVKIPSMIVQPYVENAVKHGLLHKIGKKDLLIDFVRVNGTVCITIDDNGVGRAKAAEIKQSRNERHDSFATKANNKRIEILNKGRSKNIGVVYIDKEDDMGLPSGTTVIISIPLN